MINPCPSDLDLGMKIDSATRAALRKRKENLPQQPPALSTEQTNDVRAATRAKLSEILGDTSQHSAVAQEIEEQLFDSNKGINANYRSGFRRLFTCLRDPKTGFIERLNSGELSGREFASKPIDELKSQSQRDQEDEIKRENIQKSVGHTMLPETISQMKDGRDREKWGVSRSAAALDD